MFKGKLIVNALGHIQRAPCPGRTYRVCSHGATHSLCCDGIEFVNFQRARRADIGRKITDLSLNLNRFTGSYRNIINLRLFIIEKFEYFHKCFRRCCDLDVRLIR